MLPCNSKSGLVLGFLLGVAVASGVAASSHERPTGPRFNWHSSPGAGITIIDNETNTAYCYTTDGSAAHLQFKISLTEQVGKKELRPEKVD